jgi:hypothetical protein
MPCIDRISSSTFDVVPTWDDLGAFDFLVNLCFLGACGSGWIAVNEVPFSVSVAADFVLCNFVTVVLRLSAAQK